MAWPNVKPQDPNAVQRTLRFRLKDKHAPALLEASRWVNFVWNYCNETAVRMFERERKFVTKVDLDRLTSGATREGIPLHSQTIQAISAQYVQSRRQHKKVKLRWRVSRGAKRSLGWVPLKSSAIQYRQGQFHVSGLGALSIWDSYGLHAGMRFGVAHLSEDARGRWYLNVVVTRERRILPKTGKVTGADLGLNNALSLSDGAQIEAPRSFRQYEERLAVAQRARKPGRARAIHAKIANARKDFLHKTSTALVREFDAIFIGNVSSTQLAKTRMAKSVYDVAWGSLRTMTQDKGDDAGRLVDSIDEAFSTQDCHVCGTRCGPKGLAGLAVRQWTCVVCGTVHQRDQNSAHMIEGAGC